MATQKTIFKPKAQLIRVFDQAKRSLATIEKQTVAKARTFVKIPSALERRQMTRDRILSSLQKLGVATQSELSELHSKIRKLENELHTSKKKSSGKSKTKG